MPVRLLAVLLVALVVGVAPLVTGAVDDRDEGALPAPIVVLGALVARAAAWPAPLVRLALAPAPLFHDRSPPSR